MAAITVGGERFSDSPRSNGAGSAILPAGGDGDGVEFALGVLVVEGRLPVMPRRMALITAYASSVDEERYHDTVCVCSAAIGLCWSGLNVGHWRRDFGRDLIDYGEAVQDALMKRGVDFGDIDEAGRDLLFRIIESIPSQAEVDEEREDFTDRRPDDSDETPAAESPAAEAVEPIE